MFSDRQLITNYVKNEDEISFRQLTERYLHMVYSIALRVTGNNELAQEVVQDVFTVMARKSKTLQSYTSLGGWLTKTTVYESKSRLRKERGHQNKIMDYQVMLELNQEEQNTWSELKPHLDEALVKLPTIDREILVLRFFKNKKFKEIGSIIGKTEDASRMRVNNALKRLSGILRRRGVVVSATIMGALLGAVGKSAAASPLPAGMSVAGIAQTALLSGTGAASTAGVTEIFTNTIMTMKYATSIKITVAVLVLTAVPLIVHHKQSKENQAIHEKQLSQNRAERGRQVRSVSRVNSSRFRSKEPVSEDEIRSILYDENTTSRTIAWLQLLERFGAEDFAKAAADFSKLDIRRQRQDEYKQLLISWVKVDPEAAMNHKPVRWTTVWPRTKVAAWGAVDPEGAFLWLKEKYREPYRGARAFHFSNVIKGVVSSHGPARGMEMLQQLPDKKSRVKALREIIAPYVLDRGMEEAIRWYDSIPDKDLRDGAKGPTDLLIARFTKDDPQKMIQWLESLEDSAGKQEGMRIAVREWVTKDPDAAIGWAATLQGEHRREALKGAMYGYVVRDLTEATEWLRSMSGESNYEELLSVYVHHASRKDPGRALAEIPNFQNEKLRQTKSYTIFSTWYLRNPSAAGKWAENNSLPEGVYEKTQDLARRHHLNN